VHIIFDRLQKVEEEASKKKGISLESTFGSFFASVEGNGASTPKAQSVEKAKDGPSVSDLDAEWQGLKPAAIRRKTVPQLVEYLKAKVSLDALTHSSAFFLIIICCLHREYPPQTQMVRHFSKRTSSMRFYH
jgi:hypothetical protein